MSITVVRGSTSSTERQRSVHFSIVRPPHSHVINPWVDDEFVYNPAKLIAILQDIEPFVR